jgi:NADH-quinone oxidoreductase subunit C
MEASALLSTVQSLHPGITPREKADRTAVAIPTEDLLPIMRELHDRPDLSFDMLYFHTAIDWLAENRFELVYELYSLRHRHHLLATVSVPRDKPQVASVSKVWRIAEWQEREVYDMFGVLYAGHPDLRRLLLDDSWSGFPLRKDYQDDFMLQRPQ